MPDVSKQRLLLATHNAHKTREVREILGPSWLVEDLAVLPDLPGVEETGSTFEDNAILKALAAAPHYEGWVLADDSGLEVDALGGAPGVRSARFAGVGSDMAENRALLIERMRGVRGPARRGRFRCVLALAKGNELMRTFAGAVEGFIAPAERGSGGFGYDPLFIPEGSCRTFAEFTAEQKHSCSHRGRALAQAAAYLRSVS